MVRKTKLTFAFKRHYHFLIHATVVNANRFSRSKCDEARTERLGFRWPSKQKKIGFVAGIKGNAFNLGGRLIFG
jgi:hypothetical protein